MRNLFPKLYNCHTLDRENMLAIGECGEGGINSDEWQLAAETKLMMETWAQ